MPARSLDSLAMKGLDLRIRCGSHVNHSNKVVSQLGELIRCLKSKSAVSYIYVVYEARTVVKINRFALKM